jgi:hypothetical protein
MLIKLIRYEFKALLRILPALYLALLALAAVTGINSLAAKGRDFYWGAGLLYTLWGMMFLAVFIVNLVIVILRFRDNFLRDEGYLMFTLPVPEWELIASKASAAFCTFLLTGITCALSLLIFVCIADYRQVLGFLPRMFRSIFDSWAYITPPVLIIKTVTALAFTFQQLCLVYAAMTASQIAPRFRSLAGFGAYFAVMAFVQHPLTRLAGVLSLSGTPRLLAFAFLEAAFAALYFWCATWLLKHRINLE